MALLNAAKENAIKDIETSIKSSHEQLELHKQGLVDQVLGLFSARQKALLDNQKQFQEANAILNDTITQAKRIARMGDIDKLKPICEILIKVNQETKSISADLHLGENYLSFDPNHGLEEFKYSVCSLGRIYSKGFLPSAIAFRNVKSNACQQAVVPVDIYDHHGDKLAISAGPISLEVTDATDTKLRTHLCTDSPECILTFTPQMSGLHKVSGMFLGQELVSEQTHISVNSNNPILKFGEIGDGNGWLDLPWGIAIDHKNCIYVTDTYNKLIQKFNSDGEFLIQFNVGAHAQDDTTYAVALDLKRGLIFCTVVVDQDDSLHATNKIRVFDLEGQLQQTHTLSGGRRAFFLAVDGQGDIIISTRENERLFKVDKDGNFIGRIGHLKSPGYIAISNDDSIIVPDKGNDCVFIFNPDGSVRYIFGSTGEGKGQFKEPIGVATDGEYILVSDRNDRVQVFTNDGTFVSMIESTEDPLCNPRGLAVTTDGHVYVVDSNNDCIKKYKYRDM